MFVYDVNTGVSLGKRYLSDMQMIYPYLVLQFLACIVCWTPVILTPHNSGLFPVIQIIHNVWYLYLVNVLLMSTPPWNPAGIALERVYNWDMLGVSFVSQIGDNTLYINKRNTK